MIVGSVCSGIGGCAEAAAGLGWKHSFFSEVEKFPRAVLKHRHGDIPIHGDFTTIQEGDYEPIELLIGGTPCQSFSVAGKRLGLDDPRGNLAIEYLRLARRLKPRWLVFENVPGLLSSDKGRDFGAFLGLLGECGYGFAYRVLDAQYFGVPQRRRRVFVIGYLGDWRRAAAVLFERESLQGHSAPSREAGEGVAGSLTSRASDGGDGPGAGTDEAAAGYLQAVDVSPTIRAGGNGTGDDRPPGTDVDTADSLIVTHTLTGEGFDASEDGTGRETPLVAFETRFARNGRGAPSEIVPPLKAQSGETGKGDAAPCVMDNMAVRRLTPNECARLQGYPDNYARIPWRGKPAEDCPDGPQYKAYGNSWAVPVVAWILNRIDMADKL